MWILQKILLHHIFMLPHASCFENYSFVGNLYMQIFLQIFETSSFYCSLKFKIQPAVVFIWHIVNCCIFSKVVKEKVPTNNNSDGNGLHIPLWYQTFKHHNNRNDNCKVFHSENILSRVVESTQFTQQIEKANYVGSDIKLPSKNRWYAVFYFNLILIYEYYQLIRFNVNCLLLNSNQYLRQNKFWWKGRQVVWFFLACRWFQIQDNVSFEYTDHVRNQAISSYINPWLY